MLAVLRKSGIKVTHLHADDKYENVYKTKAQFHNTDVESGAVSKTG